MLVNKYYNAIVSARLMEIATAAASVGAAVYADAIALGPTAIPASSIGPGPTAVKSISMQIYAT